MEDPLTGEKHTLACARRHASQSEKLIVMPCVGHFPSRTLMDEEEEKEAQHWADRYATAPCLEVCAPPLAVLHLFSVSCAAGAHHQPLCLCSGQKTLSSTWM